MSFAAVFPPVTPAWSIIPFVGLLLSIAILPLLLPQGWHEKQFWSHGAPAARYTTWVRDPQAESFWMLLTCFGCTQVSLP